PFSSARKWSAVVKPILPPAGGDSRSESEGGRTEITPSHLAMTAPASGGETWYMGAPEVIISALDGDY
ncbi:hypothetical protein, partial [Bifidobacterium breve]